MHKKRLLTALLCFFALMAIPQVARAATITSATLDKDIPYLAGQTGYILVTVYNDKSDKIRVTELSATINYYYTDGTVYLQKFFTSATLPDEIQAGQSGTYQIPLSLPTNIAAGYTNPTVEAKTDLWRPQDSHWATSDRPTYPVKLYIESPYKQSYESSQQQVQEQKAANENLNSMMSLFAGTTIVFASAAAFLIFFVFARKAKPTAQPTN